MVGYRSKEHELHVKAHARWQHMMNRCYNKSDRAYPRYGGRGIKVCRRWHKFPAYWKDVGDAPDGKWLDRRDNDGDYTPDNCHWVTPKESAANRKSIQKVIITHNGSVVSCAEAARLLGIKYRDVTNRLYRMRKRGASDTVTLDEVEEAHRLAMEWLSERDPEPQNV